jgi:hypothetical protein
MSAWSTRATSMILAAVRATGSDDRVKDCCNSEEYNFIVLPEGIREAIYTLCAPSWFRMDLLLCVHTLGIDSDGAALFMICNSLISQHFETISSLPIPSRWVERAQSPRYTVYSNGRNTTLAKSMPAFI